MGRLAHAVETIWASFVIRPVKDSVGASTRLVCWFFLLGVSLPCFAEQRAMYLVVEKEARRLTLYRTAGEPIKSYRVALGGNPTGHKQYEGDERTPEGTYSIDFKNPNSAYHLSLKISYPNEEDSARAASRGRSPGGLIMIHGIGDHASWRHPEIDWTDGCIAVTNEEIEEIWGLVNLSTPIVIRP